MKEIQLIEINEDILAQNKATASEIKQLLKESRTALVNVMGSPGAGKTSVIVSTVKNLPSHMRVCVIQADLDSSVDAQLCMDNNIDAVQIKTGGFCHVNPSMLKKTLSGLDLTQYDLLILENVGNLVCPAQVELGSTVNAMLLSVPEGDDKPLKYPVMFANTEVLIINKTDYLAIEEYNMEKVQKRVERLNESITIFPLSCKTQEGVQNFSSWLTERLAAGRT